MSYSPAFLDELRRRTTLSELVAGTVKLVRAGRGEQRGICPFHSEKTASFYVIDDKDLWHCFGCLQHGDAISWIERTEDLDFLEAVERLADLAGMELPKQSPKERERYQREATLYDVLEGATEWFERRLKPGTPGWDYLRGRGLEEATIRKWRLGWAPDAWRELRGAFRNGDELLLEAGLIRQPDRGGDPYDFFRGRIIFPITDRRDRVIAFTGRSLEADAHPPKYLNSPENALFRKGHTLYGAAAARIALLPHPDAPQNTETPLLVVEGPTDVLSLSQAGLAAVAPLGTAMTAEHLHACWRLSQQPVCVFDGDAAGKIAAGKIARLALPLLQPGRSLSFARIPDGEDPDSLIRSLGRAAIDRVIAERKPISQFLFEYRAALNAADTPDRRADLKHRLEADCALIRDETVRTEYRTFIARATAATPAISRGPRLCQDDYMRDRLEGLFRLLADAPGILPDLADDLAALDLDFAPDLARLRAAMLAGDDWRAKLYNGLADAAAAVLLPAIGSGLIAPAHALVEARRLLAPT